MALNTVSPGLDFIPAYQISGMPFVLSGISVPALGNAPIEVRFPYVSRRITVRNDGLTEIRVGFSLLGTTGSVTNNYFTLTPGTSYDDEFRVTSVWFVTNAVLSGSTATVIAALTPIKRSELTLNWSGSSGVG